MEMWDILDINRQPTGRTIGRGVERKPFEFHIVVTALITNSKGEFLMTLRSPKKDYFPNLWEFTIGSTLAGETSLQGIVREIKEETGITVKPEDMNFIGYTINDNNTTFLDYYTTKKDFDISEVVLQDGETADAKWVSEEELYQMIKNGTACPDIAQRYEYIIMRS